MMCGVYSLIDEMLDSLGKVSLTDWVQILTLGVVACYTWLTYRLFLLNRNQNEATQEQLRLQREDNERQSRAADEASIPNFEWSLPQSDGSAVKFSGKNKGGPISNLTMEASDVRLSVAVRPTVYLEWNSDADFELTGFGNEELKKATFRFSLNYDTRTGARYKSIYEVVVGSSIQKLGHERLSRSNQSG